MTVTTDVPPESCLTRVRMATCDDPLERAYYEWVHVLSLLDHAGARERVLDLALAEVDRAYTIWASARALREATAA